jgi:hypothetical protein
MPQRMRPALGSVDQTVPFTGRIRAQIDSLGERNRTTIKQADPLP